MQRAYSLVPNHASTLSTSKPQPRLALKGHSRYSRYSRGHLEPEPHFALEARVDALLLGGAVALQQHT